MWPPTLTLDLLLLASLSLGAHGERTSYRPQSCTIECIRWVYHSDPFTNLSLDREYVVTVMALPVPERWDQSYEKKKFFTRTCPEKNGLEECEKGECLVSSGFLLIMAHGPQMCSFMYVMSFIIDWYPRYVEVHQENRDVYVTFNLAPENFEVRQYFSSCFGGGLRNYTSIKPDFSLNKTHHTYRLQNLQAGTNYTCEIAADIVDAVRKTFVVVVKHSSEEPSTSHFTENPSLTVLLSVGILLAATAVLTFTVVNKKRLKKKKVQTKMRPEIIEQYYDKKLGEGQCVLPDKTTRPPRLLICYSSNDGPAHVRVVLQLAAFLQKHMATQVHLDLWEALRIMEEGSMGWHCKRMKDCDFVLIICSRGLHQNQSEDEEPLENNTLAIVSMIGEELCRAKALGQDLSKFMVAIFEYSQESDIPAVLGLASRYTLTKDLPLLFSHLHGVALQKPGVYLQVENILESGYCKLPAGAALQLAIQEAKAQFSEEPTEEEHVRVPIIS
ncbi:unnamed protein product [Leuciscus chuanchicus]